MILQKTSFLLILGVLPNPGLPGQLTLPTRQDISESWTFFFYKIVTLAKWMCGKQKYTTYIITLKLMN